MPIFGGVKIPNCLNKQLYFSANLSKLSPQLEKNPQLTANFDFFVGCSLWDSSELEHQLQRGIWVAVKAPVDEILAAQRTFSRPAAAEVNYYLFLTNYVLLKISFYIYHCYHYYYQY